jgi:hypothetical protein
VAEMLSPPPQMRQVPGDVPPAYALLLRLPRGPILDLPVLNDDPMLWAARHDLTVVNGLGSFTPHDIKVLDRYVHRQWLDQVPEDVDTSKPTTYLEERFDVRYVIVPAGRMSGLRPLEEAFDRSRTFSLVADAWNGDRIYEMRRR